MRRVTDFTIASFNVKNLIGAEQEYYRFEQYTAEEYAWKADWMADQLLSLSADIVGFQEIFDDAALAQMRGREQLSKVLTEASKRFGENKAIVGYAAAIDSKLAESES